VSTERGSSTVWPLRKNITWMAGLRGVVASAPENVEVTVFASNANTGPSCSFTSVCSAVYGADSWFFSLCSSIEILPTAPASSGIYHNHVGRQTTSIQH
jgi:hypothetical protein